jgi:hypothetical protein
VKDVKELVNRLISHGCKRRRATWGKRGGIGPRLHLNAHTTKEEEARGRIWIFCGSDGLN